MQLFFFFFSRGGREREGEEVEVRGEERQKGERVPGQGREPVLSFFVFVFAFPSSRRRRRRRSMRLAQHSLRPLSAFFQSQAEAKTVPLQQRDCPDKNTNDTSGDGRCEWTDLLSFESFLFFRNGERGSEKAVELWRARGGKFLPHSFFSLFLPPFRFVVARVRLRERERSLFRSCSLASLSVIERSDHR